MINVMLIDDQVIVREGLKMMISLSDEINVTSEFENPIDAFEDIKNNIPDIILMDIRMPKMDGVQATKLFKQKYPSIKIIILTTFNEDKYIFDGLKNGADAYLLKDAGSSALISSIKTVFNGNMLLHPEIASKVINSFNSNKTIPCINESPSDKKLSILTPRELEIANLVKYGKSNKEIASELFITEGTVKNHISNILSKLELNSRTQLATFI